MRFVKLYVNRTPLHKEDSKILQNKSRRQIITLPYVHRPHTPWYIVFNPAWIVQGVQKRYSPDTAAPGCGETPV